MSGTTAASAGAEPPQGAGAQAVAAFGIALDALADLGFGRADVVRTRMYLTDIADADAVGLVHGELFADVLEGAGPAATMVAVTALVDPALVVEVELEARRRGQD